MSECANAAMSAGPDDLNALAVAISSAIEALIAWDVAAFHAAVEQQSALCSRIASSRTHRGAEYPAAAQRVRELNCVYNRLLQHSIHWTRVLRAILETAGHVSINSTSVHFRG